MANVQTQKNEWRAAWRSARVDFWSEVDDTVATTPLDDQALSCLVKRQTRRMDLRDRLHFFKSKKWVSNFLN